MKTPAVVWTAPGVTQYQEIEMPAPRPGEVQIRTEYSTISAGTEGWALQNRFTWMPTIYPSVPGYQRVGIVEALGEGVTEFQIGERVAATNGVWEGEVAPFWGSHVAVANTHEYQVFRLPEGIDAIDAAGVVVAQVGYNAASRIRMRPGDWVLVLGDGIIGQSAAQAARARGAQVILGGHRQDRLDLGAVYSADAVINTHDDIVEAAREIIGADTVTAIIDTVQSESVQHTYMPLLAHATGQIVYSGFTPGASWADMGLLQQQELTTHFVSGWTRPRMEATLRLLATRRMQLKPLTTHLVSPREAPQMYNMIETKSSPFLGITFDWSDL